ncbi:MAG TPA: hypothetical protein VFX78_10195, partial [Candidatus Eisenbacteria bacterium]|nr:hypothetical protein [Candidatus Eisenbacteria bacterium]
MRWFIVSRWFTAAVSILFVAIGIWMITDGERIGWVMAGFFGLCLLVAIFEPALARFRASFDRFRLVITEDEIACEHSVRKRESIRWNDVSRIWYVTTDAGPRVPDEWFLLESESGGCSFPSEATGLDVFWNEV